jgi:hypothetical protein
MHPQSLMNFGLISPLRHPENQSFPWLGSVYLLNKPEERTSEILNRLVTVGDFGNLFQNH